MSYDKDGVEYIRVEPAEVGLHYCSSQQKVERKEQGCQTNSTEMAAGFSTTSFENSASQSGMSQHS